METRVSRKREIPIYKEIEDFLREFIDNAKEMDKLPTEMELARKFGVSHVTVRRAIAELEKHSLIVRRPGIGTFVRKLHRLPDTFKYLVVLPPKRTVSTGFFIPPIISGILSAELESDFDIQTFSYYSLNFSDMLNVCAEYGVNGVIWITPDLSQLDFVKELEKFSYPVICVNRIETGVNYVSTDHEKSTEDMTDFLLRKGHKRIGFVGFCEVLSYINQRYKGFLNSFKKAGINFDCAGLVKMRVTKHRPFEFDIPRFKFDLLDMLEKYRPSAILILGGGLIDLVLDTLIEKGIKIPEELEVATFDEVSEKYRQKKYIHEIVQPLAELGRLACGYLEKLVKEKTDKVAITLPAELIFKSKGGD